jgi:hypothetical protein
MTLEIRGERRRVHVASWVRDGASVEQTTVSFLEDEGWTGCPHGRRAYSCDWRDREGD